MFKGRNQSIMMLIAVAALVFLLCNLNSKSSYTISEREYASIGPSVGRRGSLCRHEPGHRPRLLSSPP